MKNQTFDIKMLRPAKLNEMKPGGVWYYKNGKGEFKTVISDLDHISDLNDYKRFIRDSVKFGYAYIRRDKPNYSLSEEMKHFDKERLEHYSKKA